MGLGEEAGSEPSTLWPQQLDKGACLLTLTLRIIKGWASLPPPTSSLRDDLLRSHPSQPQAFWSNHQASVPAASTPSASR